MHTNVPEPGANACTLGMLCPSFELFQSSVVGGGGGREGAETELFLARSMVVVFLSVKEYE